MQRIKYVVNHPHFPAYIFYCLAYVCYGAIVTALGPIIPYLAEQNHRNILFVSFLVPGYRIYCWVNAKQDLAEIF